MKEWEEKFDREQKAREHKENLREKRLKKLAVRLKSNIAKRKQVKKK